MSAPRPAPGLRGRSELLADDLPLDRDAHDHGAASAVEEGTERLTGSVDLAGGLFEVERGRLTTGRQALREFVRREWSLPAAGRD